MDQNIKDSLKNWGKIVRKYQKPDAWKATVQLLNTFLPFIGLWTLMYFSLSWSYLLTIALGFVNAFFLVRIFIIQHDCGHQSFLGSRKMNNFIGWICSFFSTLPFNYWAKVHNHHHAHTGQLEHRDIGDINFLTVEEYRRRSWFGKLRYRIFRHPLVLFVVAPVFYISLSNRLPTIQMRGWKKVYFSQMANNIVLVGVYLLLGYLLGWAKFFIVQGVVVFFFGIIAFWFFYVQHQHEHTYMHWRKNWDYVIAAIKGATFYNLPKMFHWLTGNIGYHHIHHLSAAIPNYNLAKCAKENPVLQKFVTKMSFRNSLKLMFNKLWDEQSGRMITFKEYYQLERMRQAA